MIIHQDFTHRGELPPKAFLDQIADYKTAVYMLLWEIRNDDNMAKINWEDLKATHSLNSFNCALRKLHTVGLIESIERHGTLYQISLVGWDDIETKACS